MSDMGTANGAASRTPKQVEIYDTTLRDGSQLEGISFTVEDKLKIARQLDRLGVHYIEGGWPGANPKVQTPKTTSSSVGLRPSSILRTLRLSPLVQLAVPGDVSIRIRRCRI